MEERLPLGLRQPKFTRLQQELAVAIEKFIEAAKSKQQYLAELGAGPAITLEQRRTFLEALKVEQQCYRAIQDIQNRVLELLREDVHGR